MRKLFQKKTLKELSAFSIWYIIVFFVILRLPSLIEPVWYADEGIYEVIANAMHNGRVLYSQVWDNKPPLLYILYFLTGNLFGIKLLSIMFGIGEVYFFYKIAKVLFNRQKSILISTILFTILLGSPFIEGNIANAENFMILPILVSFYILLRKNSLQINDGIWAGIFFFIALLLKFVAVFDLIVWVIWASIHEAWGKGVHTSLRFKKSVIYMVGVLTLLGVVTAGVLLLFGILGDFYNAVFVGTISYISEKNTAGLSNSLLIIKIILLFTLTWAIFLYRKKLSKETMFILLWTNFSLFNVFFSQRLFLHYLLLLAAPFSLLVGSVIDSLGKKRLILSLITVICTILIWLSFTFYHRTFEYYGNYFQFVFMNKNIDSYQRFFDKDTPRNYEIARIISSTMKDKNILVWSDGGEIYALLGGSPFGKYVVAYHMLFYKSAYDETKALFEKSKPDVIVEVTEIPKEMGLLDDYQESFHMEGIRVYERQF